MTGSIFGSNFLSGEELVANLAFDNLTQCRIGVIVTNADLNHRPVALNELTHTL